jgi:aerobic C4-dicarboxylate transport protein
MKKLFTNLTFWVLTAITLGILLGHFRPDLALMKVLEEPIKGRFLGQELEIGATFSEMLGKTFISIVKLFINPIIFLTITLGIISMGEKSGESRRKSVVVL